MTHIRWFDRLLEARHAPQFAAGTRVAWSVPASHIVLHRRDRPSRGERENPVTGEVVRCTPMGAMTAVALRVVRASGPTSTFPCRPTSPSARNASPGATASVSLLADGIHLMPLAAAVTSYLVARVERSETRVACQLQQPRVSLRPPVYGLLPVCKQLVLRVNWYDCIRISDLAGSPLMGSGHDGSPRSGS